MDVAAAAARWRETWQRAWPAKDTRAIAALYAEGAAYRSHPLRPPAPSPLAYVEGVFAEEDRVECRFGEPVVAAGDRAAIEWWAAVQEGGETVTLTGATVLRFGPDGLVREHVDYWLQAPGRVEPYAGWGR